MSCDRCGNATRPLAEDNGEMLCDGCLDPEDELPLLYDLGDVETVCEATYRRNDNGRI